MKHISALAVAVAVSSGCAAYADGPGQVGIHAHIEDKFVVTKRSQPATRRECNMVDVPIYGTTQGSGASGGDVLTGMIIGGLLGKGASGNDKGAAAGAVIGGIIAADKKKSNRTIIGYRQDLQCHNVTTQHYTNERRVYSHSIIRWRINGKEYTARFVK